MRSVCRYRSLAPWREQSAIRVRPPSVRPRAGVAHDPAPATPLPRAGPYKGRGFAFLDPGMSFVLFPASRNPSGSLVEDRAAAAGESLLLREHSYLLFDGSPVLLRDIPFEEAAEVRQTLRDPAAAIDDAALHRLKVADGLRAKVPLLSGRGRPAVGSPTAISGRSSWCRSGLRDAMEEVVTSPAGQSFLVRVTKPGDYGEYGSIDSSGNGDLAVLAVKVADRMIHHHKWRVTVWPWPSKPSIHGAAVSELFDTQDAAAQRADELVEQIAQGVLRP